MPRYYCDYCDTYLTHDSPSVRKQHNAGYKHKANVRTYYQQFEEQQTQRLIDQRIKEHLGQAAAFQQQIGATYNQHLVSLPGNPPRPRLPILPPNMMPIGSQPPLNSTNPGIRPPVLPLPRPLPSTPGYGVVPTVPTLAVPPGTSTFQMPPVIVPPAPGAPNPIIGSSTTPTSNSTPDSFKEINDEGMSMCQRPFMRGKLYIHFSVDFPDFLTPDQSKAMDSFLPPKAASQLTDMELDECEETTLHDVNIEEEMRRKQAQQAQEAYDEDGDMHGGAQRMQCAQQ